MRLANHSSYKIKEATPINFNSMQVLYLTKSIRNNKVCYDIIYVPFSHRTQIYFITPKNTTFFIGYSRLTEEDADDNDLISLVNFLDKKDTNIYKGNFKLKEKTDRSSCSYLAYLIHNISKEKVLEIGISCI